MAKLSKNPPKEKVADRAFQDLCIAISLLESKGEIEGFVFDLLTPTERQMLAKRFQIALMLLEGNDYRKIRDNLKVTDNTIARVSNWLKTGADTLTATAKKLLAKEKEIFKTEKTKKKYAPGDLVTPAIEEGLSVVAKKMSQRRCRG